LALIANDTVCRFIITYFPAALRTDEYFQLDPLCGHGQRDYFKGFFILSVR